MKLRNKKTGEIGTPRVAYQEIYIDTENHMTYCYKTLHGVFEEWEDYEETNIYYFIDIHGQVKQMEDLSFDWQNKMVEIGNYFETKEEAEKAVKKLKAWKRLKDARFEFGTIKYNLDEESSSTIAYDGIITIKGMAYEDFVDDLGLLFGGEE